MGKNEKNLKKKYFGFGKKKFGSETDTKIESWFRFPIPQTNFGLTRVPTIANRDPRSHTTSPTIDLFLKLGFHGACYIYAVLAFLCAFWGAATIPDNRGKSLVKVEEFYENKTKNPNKMNI